MKTLYLDLHPDYFAGGIWDGAPTFKIAQAEAMNGTWLQIPGRMDLARPIFQ
jgi:hypothetical protein